METGIEDMAGLVRDLNFVDDAPQNRGQEPLRSTRSHLRHLDRHPRAYSIS